MISQSKESGEVVELCSKVEGEVEEIVIAKGRWAFRALKIEGHVKQSQVDK